MLYYTKKVIIPSGRTGVTHMINKIVLACTQDLLEFSQLIAKVTLRPIFEVIGAVLGGSEAVFRWPKAILGAPCILYRPLNKSKCLQVELKGSLLFIKPV